MLERFLYPVWVSRRLGAPLAAWVPRQARFGFVVALAGITLSWGCKVEVIKGDGPIEQILHRSGTLEARIREGQSVRNALNLSFFEGLRPGDYPDEEYDSFDKTSDSHRVSSEGTLFRERGRLTVMEDNQWGGEGDSLQQYALVWEPNEWIALGEVLPKQLAELAERLEPRTLVVWSASDGTVDIELRHRKISKVTWSRVDR